MKNQLINDLFLDLQKQMQVALGMNSSLSHPTDKGDVTEKDWRKWFDTYLPKRYSVTKGKVVDCEGNESEQIDIIIYDRQYSPLVFDYNDVTYVTAESVYAIFEVKQKLTKPNIQYAEKKARSVRNLRRTSAKIVYSTGLKEPKPLHRIIAGILTTSCQWKDIKKEIRDNVKMVENMSRLDIICSLSNCCSRIVYNKNSDVSVIADLGGSSLMNLFFTVLTQLQVIGTVPAIEYDQYYEDAPSIEKIYNESANQMSE